jgi:hypothetical protein
MKPPRRWMVWLVVLVMGIGWASEPCRALTAPDRRLVIPIEAPEEQSGEPEPGPVPIWIGTQLMLLARPIREAGGDVLSAA